MQGRVFVERARRLRGRNGPERDRSAVERRGKTSCTCRGCWGEGEMKSSRAVVRARARTKARVTSTAFLLQTYKVTTREAPQTPVRGAGGTNATYAALLGKITGYQCTSCTSLSKEPTCDTHCKRGLNLA